ncbi:hypothetical protein BDN72DRAFT_850618 [Pluteus cervinus]|uniref:Uncharacterized protein n=1 Tax=Pluteus cervinus TaxID=181527 RepID=A0ACD3A457_9AGAR|nr:hypothetical protein BDN72DRAFT_850618 [Pluteus cervinus]
MESLPHALRPRIIYDRPYIGNLTEIPDGLWAAPVYNRGDRRPPVLHFAIQMNKETEGAFFRTYPRSQIEQTVKEFDLSSEVPAWSYIEHIAGKLLGRKMLIHAVCLNDGIASVLLLWNNYSNGARGRTLTKDEKKLCDVFEAQPAWYLDANDFAWDIKP